MKKTIFILLFASLFFAPALTPRAEAMDPVTIAILTPLAIKGAQIAAPYVIRGLQNGAKHMLTMGEDFIGIFKLPVGILQATIGAPFGMFTAGAKNTVKGVVAPFKLTFKILLLPLAFFGVGVG